jgi:hypothetical protein
MGTPALRAYFPGQTRVEGGVRDRSLTGESEVK